MSDSDDSVGGLHDSDKEEAVQYFSTNYAKVLINFQGYCEQRT